MSKKTKHQLSAKDLEDLKKLLALMRGPGGPLWVRR